MTSGPLSEMMHKMKAALVSLKKTVAWYPHRDEQPAVSVVSDIPGEHSDDLTYVTSILERLLSSGKIHMIAKNLVGQLQDIVPRKSISDSEILPEGSPQRTLSPSDLVYSYAEDAIRNLLQPYLLPHMVGKSSEEASLVRVPPSKIQSAQSSYVGKTTSALPALRGDMAAGSGPQKRGEVVNLFTRVMVHQVMDIVQAESTLELNRNQAEIDPIAQEQIIVGHPSPVPSVLGPDSSDYGCLVTVLMLRLLAKLKDQQIASGYNVDTSEELIQKVFSEFSSDSGTPNFRSYQTNPKIQAIYQAMDKFLLKEFGPGTILQRAVETKDFSFDNILLTALGKELQHQSDIGITSVPHPTVLSATTSREPVPGAATGQIARKIPKIRLNIKVQ